MTDPITPEELERWKDLDADDHTVTGEDRYYKAARTVLPRLIAEVERLRSTCKAWAEDCQKISLECDRWHRVVDKLPKTADGHPVVPGMTVWVLKFGKHLFECSAIRWQQRVNTCAMWFGEKGFDSDLDWSETYSTKATAEAAMKGSKP